MHFVNRYFSTKTFFHLDILPFCHFGHGDYELGLDHLHDRVHQLVLGRHVGVRVVGVWLCLVQFELPGLLSQLPGLHIVLVHGGLVQGLDVSITSGVS